MSLKRKKYNINIYSATKDASGFQYDQVCGIDPKLSTAAFLDQLGQLRISNKYKPISHYECISECFNDNDNAWISMKQVNNNNQHILKLESAFDLMTNLKNIPETAAREMIITQLQQTEWSEILSLFENAALRSCHYNNKLPILDKLIAACQQYQNEKTNQEAIANWAKQQQQQQQQQQDTPLSILSVGDHVLSLILIGEFLTFEELIATWIHCSKATYKTGIQAIKSNIASIQITSPLLLAKFPMNGTRTISTSEYKIINFVRSLQSFAGCKRLEIDAIWFSKCIASLRNRCPKLALTITADLYQNFDKIQKLNIQHYDFDRNKERKLIDIMIVKKLKELTLLEPFIQRNSDHSMLQFIQSMHELQTLQIIHQRLDHDNHLLPIISLKPSIRHDLTNMILWGISSTLLFSLLQSTGSRNIANLSINIIDYENIIPITNPSNVQFSILKQINNGQFQNIKELCLDCQWITDSFNHSRNQWIRRLLEMCGSSLEKLEFMTGGILGMFQFIMYMTEKVSASLYSKLKYLGVGVFFHQLVEDQYNMLYNLIVKFMEQHSQFNQDIMIQFNTWRIYQDPPQEMIEIDRQDAVNLVNLMIRLLKQIQVNTNILYLKYFIGVKLPGVFTQSYFQADVAWNEYQTFATDMDMKQAELTLIQNHDDEFYHCVLAPFDSSNKDNPFYYSPQYPLHFN